jgi:Ni,Fe-hydrogenase III large subunit
MNYLTIKNQQSVSLNAIPEIDYPEFLSGNLNLMEGKPYRHCVSYFGQPTGKEIRLFCCIADDTDHTIFLSSCRLDPRKTLTSFTAKNLNFEKFEREIHENFGIAYSNHPWLKPVRYPFNRNDSFSSMKTYPFFGIESEELHEVGVGPVHAGIIEPGHFRFVCNGEQILHLEIQLGYQHRGIEQLFLEKKKILQRVTLAENIAGDSVIGHTTAFSYLWESLADAKVSEDVLFARTLAQEIERVAIHTGDLSAICTDVAYQLGSSVFGRLRTPVINFFQEWCGNRLSKSLIRPGRNPFPFTNYLAGRLIEVLDAFEPDFDEMIAQMFKLPSALSRLERTGALSYAQVLEIGTVGMSARMNVLERDIRTSHPYGIYPVLNHQPIIKHHGDVYSRAKIRREEVKQSISYIRKLVTQIPDQTQTRSDLVLNTALKPDSFALSLTEGWRGEICHVGITDSKGGPALYKIKDPSFHNWLALALAVRNNEISDFPICNKSFDLSYCGHDL